MNLDLAYSILDILKTMQEAVKQMQDKYTSGDVEVFNSLSMDLWDGLLAVQEAARREVPAGSHIRLADACTCAMESIKTIKMLMLTKPEKVEWKLKYELDAIIETMLMQFYYWGIVEGHPEKTREFQDFLMNQNIFAELRMPVGKRGCKYDVSIVVTGYNKLEYTRRCIESLMNNPLKEANCELILINHGSHDGTREYFESIESANVFNIAVNGALPGAVLWTLQGKYFFDISNDIVLGAHALSNLYRCISEHVDYGYVVPSTSAVSNFQMIEAHYDTEEKYFSFAEKNNIYNERRQEMRVRLCNPVTIMRTDVLKQFYLDEYINYCCVPNMSRSFPDDKISLWMRRHGYKNILAKDAYCHHFGSVTIKDDIKSQEEENCTYLRGRNDFFKRYNVDPWGPGYCYDRQLFSAWEIPIVDNAYILGINCGLGSNPLKVKEILKEKGAKGSVLYNCVQDGRYLQDLQGISDVAFRFDALTEISAKTGRNYYHYIVIEGNVKGYQQKNILQEIKKSGIKFAELAHQIEENGWEIYRMKD